MTMATLQSRLSFFRGKATLADPRAMPFTSGYEAGLAGAGGDLGASVGTALLGKSPRTSHSPARSFAPGDFREETSSPQGQHSVPFRAPERDECSIAASESILVMSDAKDSTGLPPSEADGEITAMLARAAACVGLEWNLPPSPVPSRLDDWFLGSGRRSQPCPPVPFFPEVYDELMRLWRAPFSARNRPPNLSTLTTLDGGAAHGYTEDPQVDKAVAVHLCPQSAATWRDCPALPSKACRTTSSLTAKAYSTAGQAASVLHALALLQVHQAKTLKELHVGSPGPDVMQELRSGLTSPSRRRRLLRISPDHMTRVDLSSHVRSYLIRSSADKYMKIWDILGYKSNLIHSSDKKMGVLFCGSCCPDLPFVYVFGGQRDVLHVWNISDVADVVEFFGTRERLVANTVSGASTSEMEVS